MPYPLAMLQNKKLDSVFSLLPVNLGLLLFIWRHCCPDVLEVEGELFVLRILLFQHVQHLVLEVYAQVNHLIDFGFLKNHKESPSSVKQIISLT